MRSESTNKPPIVCRMLASLDGKIIGSCIDAEAIEGASQEYERTNMA